MPIRFRCAYCNQLMGIARRKAGTVVRCPACSGQVVVPHPEGEAPAKPGPNEADAPLFERSDFDEFFGSNKGKPRPTARPPTELVPDDPLPSLAGLDDVKQRRREPVFDVVALEAAPALSPLAPLPGGPGYWLSTTMMTWLSVGIVLALAVAFGLGFWVGRATEPEPAGEQSRDNNSLLFPRELLASATLTPTFARSSRLKAIRKIT